jgi:hypothetical protein
MIKHYLLSHIDAPYDTARLLNILLGIFIGRTLDQLNHTHQVICSSLIQKAFYHAVAIERRPNVIFAQNFKDEKDLEFVSPADIARSEKAVWIYNPCSHR